MWGDSFYNCFKLGDIGTRSGFKKLGVENRQPDIRGVLIDVAGFKGVDMLPTSYKITPDDSSRRSPSETESQARRTVLIRTGWSKLMGKENQRYGRSAPASVSRRPSGWWTRSRCWSRRKLLRRGAPLRAAHNLPVHAMMIIQHGIYFLENLSRRSSPRPALTNSRSSSSR